MTLNEIEYDEIKNDVFNYLMEQRDWKGAIQELCTAKACSHHDPMEHWRIQVILDFLRWIENDEIQSNVIEKVLWTIHNEQQHGREAASCLNLSDFHHGITSDDCRIAVIRFINLFVDTEISNEAESIDRAIIIHRYMHEYDEVDHEERFATKERKGGRTLEKIWQDIFFSTIPASSTATESVDSLMETRAHDTLDASPISSKENTQDTKKGSNDDYIKNVGMASDFISDNIFKGATLVADGLAKVIVPNVTKGIEAIGDFVISQNSNPSIPAKRKQDSSTSTTIKTKEEQELEEFVSLTKDSAIASDSMRQGVRTLTYGIRDYSTRQIHATSKAWQEKQIGKQVVPDDEVRETLVATGKVGVATLGASALLVESMFHTTKAIAQTSVKVAAKVGGHYHGEEVGNLIDNVGVTAGNVLRTIAHVGTLEAQVLSKAVARNSAKVEMKAKAKESVESSMKDDIEITENEKRLRDFINTTKESITIYGEKIPLAVIEKIKSLDPKDIVDGASSRSISNK